MPIDSGFPAFLLKSLCWRECCPASLLMEGALPPAENPCDDGSQEITEDTLCLEAVSPLVLA